MGIADGKRALRVGGVLAASRGGDVVRLVDLVRPTGHVSRRVTCIDDRQLVEARLAKL